VIGGGLTSAHICANILELTEGSKVVLLVRSYLTVKQFDVNHSWLEPEQNHLMFQFYNSSPREKLKMIASARTGGSITPEMYERLHPHLLSGRLEIHQHAMVQEASWDEEKKALVLTLQATQGETSLPQLLASRVILATGSEMKVQNETCLQGLLQNEERETFEGPSPFPFPSSLSLSLGPC